MKQALLWWLSALQIALWSNTFAQETESVQNATQSILDEYSVPAAVENMPESTIREITEDDLPLYALYFWKRKSETTFDFLGNGCISEWNAFTANHVATASDWDPLITYQSPQTDIFVWEINASSELELSDVYGEELNGMQADFIGIRNDKKYFHINGEIQYVHIPEVTIQDAYVWEQVVLSGNFYLMKKDPDFNSYSLSWSCVMHEGKLIGTLIWGLNIWENHYYMISRITPDILSR